MSYSIIYGQQFIKLNKNNETFYIPMVLVGDNNVYESNRKRARDFSNLTYYCGGKQYANKESILNSIDNARLSLIERYKDDDSATKIDSCYGYYDSLSIYGKSTRSTTFQNFKNLFINGIKNAVTIEQLVEIGISLELYTSTYSTDKLESLGLKQINLYPKTTEELINMIDSTETYLVGSGVSVYLTIRGSDSTLKYIKRNLQPKAIRQPKQLRSVNKYYVIAFTNGMYLYKLTSRRIFSTRDEGFGKRYLTEKSAKKATEKIGERFSMRVSQVKEVVLTEPILI